MKGDKGQRCSLRRLFPSSHFFARPLYTSSLTNAAMERGGKRRRGKRSAAPTTLQSSFKKATKPFCQVYKKTILPFFRLKSSPLLLHMQERPEAISEECAWPRLKQMGCSKPPFSSSSLFFAQGEKVIFQKKGKGKGPPPLICPILSRGFVSGPGREMRWW